LDKDTEDDVDEKEKQQQPGIDEEWEKEMKTKLVSRY
jgi:hypothetical protein